MRTFGFGFGFDRASPLASAPPLLPPVNTVLPAISGSPTEGEELSCTTGTWTGSPVDYHYQWRRDAADIFGATDPTYTLTGDDVGADIDCVVMADNTVGSTSATAAEVGPIAELGHRYWRILATCNSGFTTGSGEYSCVIGDLKFCTTPGGTNVATGGTALSDSNYDSGYLPANAFAGDGATSRWASAETAWPHWIGYDFGSGNAPAITSVEVMAGAFNVTQTPGEMKVQYSDDGTTWYDKWWIVYPGDSNGHGYVANTYKVFDKPASPQVATPEAHRYWRLNILGSNGGSTIGAAEVKLKTVSGSVNECYGGTGSALQAFNGSSGGDRAFDDISGDIPAFDWGSADPATFPQWLRYDFGAGRTVTIRQVLYTARSGFGATQSPTGFDVQYSDDGTSWTTYWSVSGITGWSNGLTKTFNHSGAAPTNTVLPAITGTPTEGQTLSVSNGTWTGSPTGYSYQWRRDGVNISGATNSTYVLVGADVGADIDCVVTATNATGSTAATAVAVGPVEAVPDVVIAVQEFNAPSSATTLDITTPALGGRTPKFALFFISRHLATNDPGETAVAGISIGGATPSLSGYIRSENHNGATYRSPKRAIASPQNAAPTLRLVNPDTSALNLEAYAQANGGSFIADGVRLKFNTTTNNMRGYVVFFAGDDLSVAFGSTGALGTTAATKNVTGLSFAPQAVIFFGANSVATASANDSAITFGIALADGTQKCMAHNENFANPGAGSPVQTVRTDRAFMDLNADGTVNYTVTAGSFTSSGFSLTTSASAGDDICNYVALNFGGRNYKLLDFDTPTSTGANAITGVGFTPQVALSFLGSVEARDTAAASSDTQTGISFSAIGNEQWAVATRIRRVSPNETRSNTKAHAIMGASATSTIAITASLTSFDADGLTLNYSAVAATAKKGFMLCVQ